jgi:hypothetical protein
MIPLGLMLPTMSIELAKLLHLSDTELRSLFRILRKKGLVAQA